jgi:hypothetical protein
MLIGGSSLLAVEFNAILDIARERSPAAHCPLAQDKLS